MSEDQFLFREINGPADVDRVAELAAGIWREHYTGLVGFEQVEYMLEHFQNAPAIRRQLAEEGCRYFVAEKNDENGEAVAYCAIRESEGPERLFLSKFYVRKDCRGLGVGRRLLRDALGRFDLVPTSVVFLTVNKGNAGSIAAYEKLGFRIAGEIVADIGNGFVMDDYRMEGPAATILQRAAGLQRAGTCGPG